MNAIPFAEATVTFAKNQPEYLQLPAHVNHEAGGCVTTCYNLTWKERFAILLGKPVWLQTLTFNQPLQPQRLSVEKPPL